MRIAPLLAVVAAACLFGVSASSAKAPNDYAAVAMDILPPGQSGSLAFPPTATDQAKLYDGLTPLFRQVTATNYASFFKPEPFGLAPGDKAVRTERPRAGLTILRDRWDVPHVYGKTRAEVEFGAGYATAEDRLLLMQLLRGPGRIAALDIPGIDPFQVAFAAQEFDPTAAAEAVLAKQVVLLQKTAQGRQLLKDVDAYIAGINAYIKANGDYTPHWTRNDVIAIAALIGARFGVGGGDEARRAEMLSALQARLGAAKGARCGTTCARSRTPRRRCPWTERSPRASSRATSPAMRSSTRGASKCTGHREARERVERAARGCEALEERASALRRRPAGRLLRSPSSCSSSTSTAAESTRAEPRSPASRSTSCSAAARTSRGARRRPAATSSTSSSRRSATATTCTTSTRASASRWTRSTRAR